jgi:hypothetical protein
MGRVMCNRFNSLFVLSLVILGLLTSPVYGNDFQFSLEENSQSLIDNGFHPSDILSPDDPTGIKVDIAADDLGLFTSFFNSDIDGFSQDNPIDADPLQQCDMNQLENGTLTLYFSVDKNAIGPVGTDLDEQAQNNQSRGDVFSHPLSNGAVTHALNVNQDGLNLQPNVGSGVAYDGGNQDELDALNIVSSSGSKFFTLNAGNQFGFSGANIFRDDLILCGLCPVTSV